MTATAERALTRNVERYPGGASTFSFRGAVCVCAVNSILPPYSALARRTRPRALDQKTLAACTSLSRLTERGIAHGYRRRKKVQRLARLGGTWT